LLALEDVSGGQKEYKKKIVRTKTRMKEIAHSTETNYKEERNSEKQKSVPHLGNSPLQTRGRGSVLGIFAGTREGDPKIGDGCGNRRY